MELRAQERDENLVKATVQKLALNSYSCSGDYSSVIISQKGIYPSCSTLV